MNTSIHPAAFRVVIAALLAGACTGALADGFEQARQRGKLAGGIPYVAPEYKGGMKFRTPESIDTALLADLASRLRLPLATMQAEPGKASALLASGKADVVLARISDRDVVPQSATVIPVAYAAGPMAITRTDTDIKRWEQLKGRTVCLSEGGPYVGMMAAKYGAIEKVQRAPADSLLAVRVGGCDAAVHDNVMLEELLKLPEWKKFSARLPTGPRSTLAFLVAANDKKTAAALKQVSEEWQAKNFPQELVKKAVRHIAFEVYLDQDVPDCH